VLFINQNPVIFTLVPLCFTH